jgi:hypothetical protein
MFNVFLTKESCFNLFSSQLQLEKTTQILATCLHLLADYWTIKSR